MSSQSPVAADPREDALAALLAKRIRSQGPISFAEFMSECLYHPEYGYYSRVATRRFGDYYTSVDVHPIFGRLIARQLAEMWELLGAPHSFLVVEAGAGVGRLAGHILDFAAREIPEFYAALQYIAVERSSARRAELMSRLAPYAGRISSAADISAAVPAAISAGCIFSNELLDALPTHRVVVEGGKLQEIFVGINGGRFTDILGEPSTSVLVDYFREQEIILARHQHAEACLEACNWIQDAGRLLGRGFVMTIDYGHEAHILYNEGHNRGTLLAYREHQVTENILEVPGRQDLTAHVNFTALDQWGRLSGLERTGLVTQSQFLVALGRGNEFGDLYDAGQTEVEKLRARLVLKNLIHPEGLGEKFQVMIQHKGIEAPQITGLSGY